MANEVGEHKGQVDDDKGQWAAIAGDQVLVLDRLKIPCGQNTSIFLLPKTMGVVVYDSPLPVFRVLGGVPFWDGNKLYVMFDMGTFHLEAWVSKHLLEKV